MKPKVRQFTRLGILLTLRESYLFCRNILGLLYHPFKTIRVIARQKDFSQAALVFGLPIYIFAFGFVVIKIMRALVGLPPSPWGPIARLAGIFLAISVFALSFYLFYWFWQVIKIKYSTPEVKKTK